MTVQTLRAVSPMLRLEHVLDVRQRQPGLAQTPDHSQAFQLRAAIQPVSGGASSARHQQSDGFVMQDGRTCEPDLPGQPSQCESLLP